MSLDLTHTAAQKKLEDVKAHAQSITGQLTTIQHEQESMLASGWKGDSAGRYGSSAGQHNEDFSGIIATLQDAVQLASQHLSSVSNADNS